MISHRHYVPILKSKQGEFNALAELREEDRAHLTPFLDVVRVPKNWNADGQSKPLGDHLDAIACKFTKVWGSRPAFVDLFDLSLTERVAGGIHPVSHIFDALEEKGATAIPTTGLDRDDAYNQAVADLAQPRGVCVRLLEEDLLSPSQLMTDFSLLSSELGVSATDVHAILDLRSVLTRDVQHYYRLVLGILRNLAGIEDLASLTVAGSSMPQTLGKIVKTGESSVLSRQEWHLWRSLLAEDGLRRRPSFGDYGIVHPDYVELDPRTIAVAPTIRYTSGSGWLILRGFSTKKDPKGFEQFHDLAADLVRRPDFLGTDSSWADDYIGKNAARATGSGNLTTWVTVGTNHHLTVVARQVATS